MEDREIIALYEKRQERAIEETAKKYGRSLRRFALNILRDEGDSEESVNDTYLRAWSSIPPTLPRSLQAYLYKLLRHIAIDRFRSRKSGKRLATEYAASLDELSECVAGRETPEDLLNAKELAGAVEDFLGSLPEEQRNIFLCRYFYCDSIGRIASYFSASQSKIKSSLHRTRCGLKEYLKQEGFFL